jgi:hypothetical protein
MVGDALWLCAVCAPEHNKKFVDFVRSVMIDDSFDSTASRLPRSDVSEVSKMSFLHKIRFCHLVSGYLCDLGLSFFVHGSSTESEDTTLSIVLYKKHRLYHRLYRYLPLCYTLL